MHDLTAEICGACNHADSPQRDQEDDDAKPGRRELRQVSAKQAPPHVCVQCTDDQHRCEREACRVVVLLDRRVNDVPGVAQRMRGGVPGIERRIDTEARERERCNGIEPDAAPSGDDRQHQNRCADDAENDGKVIDGRVDVRPVHGALGLKAAKIIAQPSQKFYIAMSEAIHVVAAIAWMLDSRCSSRGDSALPARGISTQPFQNSTASQTLTDTIAASTRKVIRSRR